MIGIEKVNAVLADPDWTRRVVIAAAGALNVLSGPDITSDGDDNRLPARSSLSTAFVDEKGLEANLQEHFDG